MLAGWGDTSAKGQSVRLWLDNESSLHPFAGYRRRSGEQAGDYFAAAFVVTQEPGGPPEAAPRGRKPSQEAHLLITSYKFRQWLEERDEYTAKLEKAGRHWDRETVRKYVKWKLGIESLSELDRDADALAIYTEIFKEPFLHWSDR